MKILAAIRREERKLEKQVRETTEAAGWRESRSASVGEVGRARSDER